METLLQKNKANQNFLCGILKFWGRVEKYQSQTSKPKLTMALHTFGIEAVTSKRKTNTALRKKRVGKKDQISTGGNKKKKTGKW